MSWWCCWLAVVLAVVVGGARAEEDPLPSDAREGRSLQGPPLRIERLQLISKPLPAVRLQLSGHGEPLTRTLPAGGGAPDRIYVDVPNAILTAGVHKVLTGQGTVRRIRTAQFGPDTARVVIELARPVAFSVGSVGQTVTIALGQDPLAAPRAVAPPAHAGHPGAPARERVRKTKGGAPTTVAATAPPPATAASSPSAAAAPAPPVAAASSPPVAAAPAPSAAAAPAPPVAAAAEDAAPAPLASMEASAVAAACAARGEDVSMAAPALVEEGLSPTPQFAGVPPAPASAGSDAESDPHAPEPAAVVTADVPATAAPPPAPALPAAAALAPPVATVNGVPFVWPALDAFAYQDAALAPLRNLIAAWQAGKTPKGTIARPPLSPPARYLAADLTFLDASKGRGDYFAAIAAYAGALRAAPDFIDAERAQFMLGETNLLLTLGPEASAAFTAFERRFPESPLMPYVHLGNAAALRLRRRPQEAHQLLDQVLSGASGDLLCRARLEEVAQGRAVHAPEAAAGAFRQLAASCPDVLAGPGMLADYAEALMDAGDRDGVRAVINGPRETRRDAEEAHLHLLAGTLFAEADNAYRARGEFDQVVTMQPGSVLAAEARMRLALLNPAGRPEQVTAALAALAERAVSPALRATMLGEAAEASARGERFEEALALLDQAAATGPEGQAQADRRRTELFARWIGALGARDDPASLATVYAAYATDLKELATLEDRLAVADALARLGLHAAAADLLQAPALQVPVAAVALAEEALAAGDAERARAVLHRLPLTSLPPELTARFHRTAARAALRAGDVDAAASEAAAVDDATVRTEVATAVLGLPGGPARARVLLAPVLAASEPPARALLTAGAAAAAENDWEAASDAYARALARTTDGAEKVEASAGLARTARARGDGAQVVAALDQLGGTGDPLFRRAAAAVGRAAAEASVEEHPDAH